MKRAEAIEWLEIMKEDAIFEQYDALKMAIDALKEQEISNELQEYAYECGYEHFFHECQNCEHRRIGNKKVDQPHGKWIETTSGTICNNCGKYPYDDGEYHIANWHSNFCPSCGADMGQKK